MRLNRRCWWSRPNSWRRPTRSRRPSWSHPNPSLRFPAPGSKRGAVNNPIKAPLWQRIVGGQTGSESGVDIATGEPAVLLFAPIMSPGWACVAVVPGD